MKARKPFIAQAWQWCQENPRKAIAAAFVLLVAVVSMSRTDSSTSTKVESTTKTAEHAETLEVKGMTLITDAQLAEYHSLKQEVTTLRKQEQTWKRTTKKRAADGSEEETTDEGSSSREEYIHDLTTKLDQTLELLHSTEDSLATQRSLVEQQSSIITSKVEQLRIANRSRFLVGVSVEQWSRPQPLWGSLGFRGGFVWNTDIAMRAEVPLIGDFNLKDMRAGFELGF